MIEIKNRLVRVGILGPEEGGGKKMDVVVKKQKEKFLWQ